MKKSELKAILKPLVKECIRESLYESGLLSNIISEVVQGVVEGQQKTIIKESAEHKVHNSRNNEATEMARNLQAAEEKKKQLNSAKKNLLDSIGKDAYNGVDLFEGTTPLSSGGSPSGRPSPGGPMSGIAPSDPGVDISALTDSLGGVWKKLAEGSRK